MTTPTKNSVGVSALYVLLAFIAVVFVVPLVWSVAKFLLGVLFPLLAIALLAYGGYRLYSARQRNSL